MTPEEQAAEHESIWGKVPFKTALQDIVSTAATGYNYDELKDDETIDADEERAEIDKTVNLLSHLFTYFGAKRLGDEFATLPFNQQMSVVGGLIHVFTSTLREGAGFCQVNMENSEWQALLVRKGSGYQAEVDALIKATEEDE